MKTKLRVRVQGVNFFPVQTKEVPLKVIYVIFRFRLKKNKSLKIKKRGKPNFEV